MANNLWTALFTSPLAAFVCEKDPDRKDYVIGVVSMIGVGFHSFVDGFIYSVGFTVSIFTGYLATVGMVLHEFPEGIVTYPFRVRGGFSDRSAVLLTYLAAAATTPLGMLVSYPLTAESTHRHSAPCSRCQRVHSFTSAPHTFSRGRTSSEKGSILVALTGGVLIAVIIVLSKG